MSSQSPLGYDYSSVFLDLENTQLLWSSGHPLLHSSGWVCFPERIFTCNLGALMGNHRICLWKSLIDTQSLEGSRDPWLGGTQHNLEPLHSSDIIMTVSWWFLLPSPYFRLLRARDLVLSGEFYLADSQWRETGELPGFLCIQPLPHSHAFSQQP